MKITINVDCTPEEARTFLGLPDLGPLHEVYLGKMQGMMSKGITPDVVEGLVKNWVPGGEAGIGLMQSLMGQMASDFFAGATGKGKRSGRDGEGKASRRDKDDD